MGRSEDWSSLSQRGRSALAAIVLALLALGQCGCKQLGPTTIPDARLDYGQMIGASNRDAIVLQLVQLRYAQMPTVLDVSQVVAGYTREHTASLGWHFNNPLNAGKDDADALLRSRITEKPTITYNLVSGEQFVQSYLTTMPAKTLLSLADSGWPIDRLLWLSAQTVNGVRNFTVAANEVLPVDSEFVRFCKVMRGLQLVNGWSLAASSTEPGHAVKPGHTLELIFHQQKLDPEMRQELREMKVSLGLAPELDRFRVLTGRVSPDSATLMISTRSLMVQVPQDHLDRGIVRRLTRVAPEDPLAPHMESLALGTDSFRIHSGGIPPGDAFVHVRHQGTSFWVENNDVSSKALIAYVELLQLVKRSGDANTPELTISAN